MQEVELTRQVLKWERATLLNPFILHPELRHILFQTRAQIYLEERVAIEDSLQKYKKGEYFCCFTLDNYVKEQWHICSRLSCCLAGIFVMHNRLHQKVRREVTARDCDGSNIYSVCMKIQMGSNKSFRFFYWLYNCNSFFMPFLCFFFSRSSVQNNKCVLDTLITMSLILLSFCVANKTFFIFIHYGMVSIDALMMIFLTAPSTAMRFTSRFPSAPFNSPPSCWWIQSKARYSKPQEETCKC